MSQSEDYLDQLLNSVSKAKSDISTSYQQAEEERRERVQERKSIAPEDDFLTAAGITADDLKPRPRVNLRKALSESDFLKEFESELEFEDTDAFIEAFESEIEEEEKEFEETGSSPSEDAVSSFLEDIDSIVNNAQAKLDEDNSDLSEALEEEPGEDESDEMEAPEAEEEVTESEEELPDFSDLSALEDISIEEGESFAEEPTEETAADEASDFDIALDTIEEGEEPPLDEIEKEMDALEEFSADEHDEEDSKISESEGGEDSFEDIGVELSDLLAQQEGDFNIDEMFEGDAEAEGDESAPAEDSAEEKPKDKGDKKDKKEKKAKDKKDKKPSPLAPLLEKLALIFFGAPTEEEIAEAEAEAAAKAEKEAAKQAALEAGEEDPKAKKKREKEEAKKAKEAEKKAKAEEKKAKEAANPKPKKEKKPKEPDNSPKISLKVIFAYLLLAASILAFIFVVTKLMGMDRHTSVALKYYEDGNYVDAYAMLNGVELADEEQKLLRDRSRLLADLQQKKEEAVLFAQYEEYDLALDSLIQGVGRYVEFKEQAAACDIANEYDLLGQEIINTLYLDYQVTQEDALAIYYSKNRHQYTLEVRKILRSLGLKDK